MHKNELIKFAAARILIKLGFDPVTMSLPAIGAGGATAGGLGAYGATNTANNDFASSLAANARNYSPRYTLENDPLFNNPLTRAWDTGTNQLTQAWNNIFNPPAMNDSVAMNALARAVQGQQQVIRGRARAGARYAAPARTRNMPITQSRPAAGNPAPNSNNQRNPKDKNTFLRKALKSPWPYLIGAQFAEPMINDAANKINSIKNALLGDTPIDLRNLDLTGLQYLQDRMQQDDANWRAYNRVRSNRFWTGAPMSQEELIRRGGVLRDPRIRATLDSRVREALNMITQDQINKLTR